MVYHPNTCTEITARLYTEVLHHYSNGDYTTASYILAPNIVYQTLKSSMQVTDPPGMGTAPIYKIVKVA